MAESIVEAFDGLLRNLDVTGLQEYVVTTRQQNIRVRLTEEFTIQDAFITGAYVRNTLIAPLQAADIDIVMVLDSRHFKTGGQVVLLEAFKRLLRKSYPLSPNLSRNSQAVTVAFPDFKVDVIPAFARAGGGFHLPDAKGNRWIDTDPRRHVQLWKEAAYGNDTLLPLIRMAKGWNRIHDDPFRSFHLETLVIKALAKENIETLSFGMQYLLEQLIGLVHLPCLDPAGYGEEIGRYLDPPSRTKLATLLGQAYQISREAGLLAASGRTALALSKWRDLFGGYFPL